MIRKTPRSGRMGKALIAALVSAALIGTYGASREETPAGPVGFAVLGDHADEVRAALGITQSQPAAVSIVLPNRWDTLPYMPDLAQFCGSDCGKGAPGQVAITELRYGATRKIVFLHLPDFGGYPAGKDCVIARAAQELRSIQVAGRLPCAPDIARDARWQLPMGLGRI